MRNHYHLCSETKLEWCVNGERKTIRLAVWTGLECDRRTEGRKHDSTSRCCIQRSWVPSLKRYNKNPKAILIGYMVVGAAACDALSNSFIVSYERGYRRPYWFLCTADDIIVCMFQLNRRLYTLDNLLSGDPCKIVDEISVTKSDMLYTRKNRHSPKHVELPPFTVGDMNLQFEFLCTA